MQRPVLAVPVCPGGIEDHAVGMQLRVIVAAGSMLEHRHCDIGGKYFDPAIPVTDAGIGAMAQHRLFQRYPGRIVMRLFDLRTQIGVGDSPQGRDALVGAEGQVKTCRAPLTAGVLCQLPSGVRCEAVVQPVEIAAIDLTAVREPEQALRIEPDAVPVLLPPCSIRWDGGTSAGSQDNTQLTLPGPEWLP